MLLPFGWKRWDTFVEEAPVRCIVLAMESLRLEMSARKRHAVNACVREFGKFGPNSTATVCTEFAGIAVTGICGCGKTSELAGKQRNVIEGNNVGGISRCATHHLTMATMAEYLRDRFSVRFEANTAAETAAFYFIQQ